MFLIYIINKYCYYLINLKKLFIYKKNCLYIIPNEVYIIRVVIFIQPK
jgi:hypothetical protein